MDNMALYEVSRVVPPEAKREIPSGRLKGKTDINPMWRIKKLTELFGPCGTGWWYTVEKEYILDDDTTKQKAAFVDILLYYLNPDTGDVSHAIPGTGGASFVAQERGGPYLSDECFKMALTDAISVAAKALGVGADVYFAADTSKYSRYGENAEDQHRTDSGGRGKKTADGRTDGNRTARKASAPPKLVCESCRFVINGYTGKNGKPVSPEAHVQYTEREYGKALCLDCARKEREARMAAQSGGSGEDGGAERIG